MANLKNKEKDNGKATYRTLAKYLH